MLITLENEKLKVVLSTFAGGIESIVNKETGNEHFWHYDSAVWLRRTSICFPICGDLTDGEYTWRGRAYPLPMHGFLREMELTVLEQSSTKSVMELVSDEKTRASFPFDFKFTLTEELSDNSLIVRYTVEIRATTTCITLLAPIIHTECPSLPMKRRAITVTSSAQFRRRAS